MPIRLARVTDEPAIASLCTAAFWDEDLFGRVIHPRRNEFPDDVKIFWHEWIRADWRDKGKIIIVAVRNEEKQEVHSGSTQREADGQDGTQGEKIVGVAVWQRKGNDEEAQRVKNDWKDPGPDAFMPLVSKNNRAMDPTAADIFSQSEPYCAFQFQGSRTNNWYLHLCCIDPAYQQRGIGRELVDWGLRKARRENVHASVIASELKEPFYLKCGFDEIVGYMSEGEGNPMGLRNVQGGGILFMWSEGSPEALRAKNTASPVAAP